MENVSTSNLAEAIREVQRIATAAAPPKVISLECADGAGGQFDVPVLMVPDGDGAVRPESLIDEIKRGIELARSLRLQNAKGPDKREGTAHHQSIQSFISHVARFQSSDSAIWADASALRLVAVLDYHPVGAESRPRWGRHRSVYACPLSAEWRAWGAGNALVLSQEKFASMLDERDLELASGKLLNGKDAPSPAFLVSLAANLEVYSTATARRERDPNTGRVKLSYSEEKGVSGDVIPPPAFLIRIPVFEGEPAESLEARLRVSVSDGEAKFELRIHAADVVLRERFERICERVSNETGLPLFVGTPE